MLGLLVNSVLLKDKELLIRLAFSLACHCSTQYAQWTQSESGSHMGAQHQIRQLIVCAIWRY